MGRNINSWLQWGWKILESFTCSFVFRLSPVCIFRGVRLIVVALSMSRKYFEKLDERTFVETWGDPEYELFHPLCPKNDSKALLKVSNCFLLIYIM